MPEPAMPPPYTLAVLHHQKVQLCRDQGGTFPEKPTPSAQRITPCWVRG